MSYQARSVARVVYPVIKHDVHWLLCRALFREEMHSCTETDTSDSLKDYTSNGQNVALLNWESDLQSNFENMTQKDMKFDEYLFYLNLYKNICLYIILL
jgi:hypothetical protein